MQTNLCKCTLAALTLVAAANATAATTAFEEVILPMGYDQSWTGRTIFNPIGNQDRHDWEKLYMAHSSDSYEIDFPTATGNADNGIVQFRTPIRLLAGHSYTFTIKLKSDKSSGLFSTPPKVDIKLMDVDNQSTTYANESGLSVSTSVLTKTYTFTPTSDIGNLMLQLGVNSATSRLTSAEVKLTVSNISLIDNTDNREIWDHTAFYNFFHYRDSNGNRIDNPTITGRSDAGSGDAPFWTEAGMDDSMWNESPMPVGNLDYMDGVMTDWPGEYNNYWIRRDFTLESVNADAEYKILVCHDDSYWLYLNGHLIDEDNSGNNDWTNGKNYITVNVPATYLNEGANTISTYIRQNFGGRFFDCSLVCSYEDHGDEGADVTQLIVSEVCGAQIDGILDYSNNYGSWIELYNPTDKAISLENVYISNDPENLTMFRMPRYHSVAPGGYICVFGDHNPDYNPNNQSLREISNYGPEADMQFPEKFGPDKGSVYFSVDGETAFLTVTYPKAISRCSYARKSVDPESEDFDVWSYNAMPTPNGANSSMWAETRLSSPVVDTDSRLFSESFSINVSLPEDAPEGAYIKYTTDGTAPTLTNGTVLADGNLPITAKANLRFATFADGYLPSMVLTRSYIYCDRDYYLPVISLTTDARNLYDNQIGAYVDGSNGVEGRNHGRSNRNMDWDRPVNFEYIVPGEGMVVNHEANFAVFGGWSRHYLPASFKIKANKVYDGLNSLDYPFFSLKPYNKHKHIQVRNGGNDNEGSHGRVRDAITQQVLLSNGFYVDAQDYQPAHVFVNGEYLGMMNIREPNNRLHGTANYGYDDDLMDAFEYSNGYYQMEGTKDDFDEVVALSAGAANAETYSQLRERIEMDEFINYWAAITYIGCTDWICNDVVGEYGGKGNNTKGYRELPDGKWHLTLLDQDWGWQSTNNIQQAISKKNNNELLTLFNNLLANNEFKRQLINAYCILNGSVFTPERCEAIGNGICELVAPALAWEGRDPWASFNEQKNNMISTSARNARMTSLRNAFGLTQGFDVSLSANIPQASLMLDRQPIPGNKLVGPIYAPVKVTASAPSGYVFCGWTAAYNESTPVDELTYVTTSQTLEFTAKSPGNYTAVFKPAGTAAEMLAMGVAPVRINEVSAKNSRYINDLIKKDPWIELYNTTDEPIEVKDMYLSDDASKPQKWAIKAPEGTSTVIAPHGYLLVWAAKRTAVSEIHANYKLANANGSMLMLTAADGSWRDVLRYNLHDGQSSVGRYPDGNEAVYQMSHPTINSTNRLSTYDFDLDEIAFDNAEPETVTISLKKGWNWLSHNLAGHIPAGSFNEHATEIRSDIATATLDDNGWSGDLIFLECGAGYKVYATEDHMIEISGRHFDGQQTVNLAAGWNWVGYPLQQPSLLTDALADFTPAEGDIVTAHTGFAIYSDGAWKGTLRVLEPGQSYNIHSEAATSFVWNRSATPHTAPRRAAETLNPETWVCDPTAYPDVMNMVAQLEKGDVIPADGYKVAAFYGDECCGEGEVIDGQVYMTIHGENEENMYFLMNDPENRVKYSSAYPAFASLGQLGTPSEPYTISLSDTTGVEDVSSATEVNAVYYNLQGLRVENPVSGVYLRVVTYSDGKTAITKTALP